MNVSALGQLRKQVEAALNTQFPLATKKQVSAIRRLSPLVAEGKLAYEDAALEVEAVPVEH